MTLVTEIEARSILSRSKIYSYTINPFQGCQHGCKYCYAQFMRRMTRHEEAWGDFVDVKVNAVDLLRQEIMRKKKGIVWVSGVCDPYQPLEAKYRLTRRCLEILIENHWPLIIQTRSPLVLRDVDLFKMAPPSDLLKILPDVEVGFSIPTADDEVRKLFEPHAPSIDSRLQTLGVLHQAGIRTYAMIAPLLPGAEGLGELLKGRTSRILIDRMNYHYADWVYRQYGFEEALLPNYFEKVSRDLVATCKTLGIECRSLPGL